MANSVPNYSYKQIRDIIEQFKKIKSPDAISPESLGNLLELIHAYPQEVVYNHDDLWEFINEVNSNLTADIDRVSADLLKEIKQRISDIAQLGADIEQGDVETYNSVNENLFKPLKNRVDNHAGQISSLFKDLDDESTARETGDNEAKEFATNTVAEAETRINKKIATLEKSNSDEHGSISEDIANGDGILDAKIEALKTLLSAEIDTEVGHRLAGDNAAKEAIEALSARLDTLIGEGNVTGIIDTFNEIEAFLAGVSNMETLTGLLKDLKTAILEAVEEKYQQKEEGKGLSSNDFTNELKAKLDAMPSSMVLTELATSKGQGKGLSTNDFTNAFKNKLNELPTAAELQSSLEDKQPAGDYLTGIDKSMVEGVLTGLIDTHGHTGLKPIKLTNEDLDDLKCDEFTVFYAEEGNECATQLDFGLSFALFVFKIDDGVYGQIIFYFENDDIHYRSGDEDQWYDWNFLINESYLDGSISHKVDKVSGKGLSSNDFSDDDKSVVKSLNEQQGRNEGNVVLVNNDNPNIKIFVNSKYLYKYSPDKWTPIGIIVIPSSHDVYGTGECGVMALMAGSVTTPNTGSNTSERAAWGSKSENLDLKHFSSANIIDGYGNNWTLGRNSKPFLPSDMDSFKSLLSLDGVARYYYGFINPLAPSPYNADGSRNTLYFATGPIASSFSGISGEGSDQNALSDFAGKENSEYLLSKATSQVNWRSDNTILNNSTDGYFPAACSCWRYHTLGTNQGDWYLPACGELGYICVRLNLINNTILALNKWSGKSYFSVPESLHWSSSYYAGTSARMVNFFDGKVDSELRNSIRYVRPFMRINLNRPPQQFIDEFIAASKANTLNIRYHGTVQGYVDPSKYMAVFNEETNCFEWGGLDDISFEDALIMLPHVGIKYPFSSIHLGAADSSTTRFITNYSHCNSRALMIFAQYGYFQICDNKAIESLVLVTEDDQNVEYDAILSNPSDCIKHCDKLRHIIGAIKIQPVPPPSDSLMISNELVDFRGCYELTDFNIQIILANNTYVSFEIGDSPNLSYDTLLYLVNNKSGDPYGNVFIKVHPDVYAKLTGDITNSAASSLPEEELQEWVTLNTLAASKYICFSTN